MADQAAIVQELFNRIGTLPPDKAAIVQELAKRFNVGPDAGAQMRASALSKIPPELRGYTQAELGQRVDTSNPLSPISSVSTADQLNNPYRQGADTAAAGVEQIAGSGGSPRKIAGGAHKVISGAGQFVSTPALAAGLVAAPLPTLAGLAGGTLAQKGTQTGLSALGVPDEYAELGGDFAGILAGHKAGSGAADLQQAVTDFGFPYMVPSDSPSLAGMVGGLPGAVAGLPGAAANVFKFKTHLDPAEAAAAQYGHENGVQMRTSILTGSKVAANAENIAQNLPLASGVAKAARAKEQSTLAAAGAREVQGLAPGSDQVPQPLDVGEALHKTAIENERTHGAAANDAYDLLRSIENQPQFTARLQTGTKLVDGGLDEAGNPTLTRQPVFEDIQLPVDYRGLKAAVKPLLAETLRPMSIAQEQSSTGIKAMRNIVEAPDFVPASVADQDLGALKTIMRDSPQSRSVGQAKFAADILSKQVDAAVARAGPDAVAALKQGRESTVAKYAAQDFQKAIGFKDVGTSNAAPGSAVDLVNNLTRDGDRSITLLRAVQEHAPEHMPALAQAFTQGLLETVTAEAGMGKPTTALTKWNKVGDQTKLLLYKDPAQVDRLTNFFTLAKKIGENPNPSGSGSLLAMVKGLGLVITQPHIGVPMALGMKPLARMLFEPTATRNLIAGMKVPADSPAAGILAKQILKDAGSDAVPVSSGTRGSMAAGASPVATSGGGNSSGSGTAGTGAPVSGEPGSGAAAGAGAAGTGGAAKRSRFTTIEIPGKPGEGYRAEYKIVDLDDVQASHSGITFQPNPKSKAANVRDYTDPVNQAKIVIGAGRGKFTPEFHTLPAADALNGPPVDDAQGQTAAGHGRTMMQERVYANNPDGAKALRDSIAEEASRIEGLNPQDAYTMKRPSLRRVISDEEFTRHGPDARANLVADTNVSGTAALTPAERAIEDSRRVSAGTLEHVAAKLDEHGEEATLAKVLAGDGGSAVLDRLVKDGVVSLQERAGLETDEGLTPAGKDRITSLMIGRFFKDPAGIKSFPPSLKNKMARIAAPLAQVEGRAGWSLTPDVKNALDMLGKMDALGYKNVDDFVKQDGLYGSQIHEAKTITLAKSLRLMGQKALERAVKQYAQDANYAAKGANTLMGDAPTPESAFADAFPEVKPPANSLAK